ncbi:MAG: hypothetical protein ACR2N8_01475 [Parvibaculales bacterium]
MIRVFIWNIFLLLLPFLCYALHRRLYRRQLLDVSASLAALAVGVLLMIGSLFIFGAS